MWAAKTLGISWTNYHFIASCFSGFLTLFNSLYVSLIFYSSSLKNQVAGLVSFIIIVVFQIVLIRRGVVAGAGAAAGAFAGAIVVLVILALAGELSGEAAGTAAAAGAFAFTLAITLAVILAVAGAVAEAGAVAGAVILAVAGTGAVVGAVAEEARAFAAILAFAGAVLMLGVGFYISWRALKGDPRDAWVRTFTIAFAAIGGTSFRGADLTAVNFSKARLKSTDMRDATLTKVRWYGAKMLDRVRPGTTYLQTPQVRQWLIGKGVDKNFDGHKLQGVNFSGAELSDASFIDANLSEANLQDADLSRAKLVQTQLDKTDFTGATLTGAFIEDWGITTHTKLDGVRCEYVYMRLPTDDDPEPCRKPDNRSEVFEDGDFGDFIKPIFDTLDLYHNQEVDPRAIAISWKELTEKNPDARLQFASMEVKGQDNLLLRFKTDPNADLSQLNAEYFETYNQIKALAEADSQKLLVEKDNRIQQLENMVNTALNRPGLYAETYHQGDIEVSESKRDIKINNGNYNESIKGNYYEQKGNFGIGHMSGGEIKDGAKVAGIINEAENQDLASAAQEIQQLLDQLAKTNPTTTTKEKMTVVGKAIDRIESNPPLKSKVINALKSGGTEAFKEAVNHPLVNILVATIEGWQDADS